MPMYDFVCNQCGHEFEELVTPKATTFCPNCGSLDIQQKMSAPSPLKTGAFPFKPGPVRPMSYAKPGAACGPNSCPMSKNNSTD